MFRGVFQSIHITIAVSAIALAGATPAVAGEDNILFIEQTSSAGGLGNSLYVDQSAAKNSVVAGNESGTTAATQSGGNNTGEITLTGDAATVIFSQANSDPTQTRNFADITGGDLASIVLNQDGFGNTGTLNIGAGGNTGILTQIGDRNTGTVKVSGTNTTGELKQTNNDNTFTLDVTGDGSTVTWAQSGNIVVDGTNTGFTPNASVTTNAGTVTVTQSGL